MSQRIFRAGAAMVELTPENKLPNYNGILIGPSPEASPLMCHAVVFDDGETQGAIVSCDATFIDRGLLLLIRDECSRATGILGSQIMVAATHTHSAPAVCPSFLTGAVSDPLYFDSFVSKIVWTLVQAQNDLKDALLVSGVCPAPGWEINRRLLRPSGLVVMSWSPNADPSYPPAGPVDSEMPFLAFEDPQGCPIAFVINYACHNNCTNGVYHGDIGGRMGESLRATLGLEIPTLFLEAPCADIIWKGKEPCNLNQDALAREIGKTAVKHLDVLYRKAPRQKVDRLIIRQEVLDISDRSWEESTFCNDFCRGEDTAAQEFARRRYDPEEAAIKNRGHTTCPVEIMGISFGDTAICTNPAELFVAYGIEIRKRSPFGVTLVSELTNGYCGYVPTKKAFAEQGYETHRTLFTSRLIKEAGRLITEKSVLMLEGLR